MAGQQDAHVLFSIGNIRAYQLQDGAETPLTARGETLSLLMVPTTSPIDDHMSSMEAQTSAAYNTAPVEEDFYLHLHLPPSLDLSLPATTQVFHQPPSSYLIPRWDLGPAAHTFLRLEFPPLGAGPDYVSQEEIDTFETILAQCTAFLERAHLGGEKGGPAKYNPGDYAPGEGYVGTGSEKGRGHIVLVDEENGSVVGELSEGFDLMEGKDVRPGSKSTSLVFLTAFVPKRILTTIHRACRDPAAARRRSPSHRRERGLRRVPPDGAPPGLRQLDHRAERGHCVAADRLGRELAQRRHAHRHHFLHAQGQAQPEADEVHAGHAGARAQAEQPDARRGWAERGDGGAGGPLRAEHRR